MNLSIEIKNLSERFGDVEAIRLIKQAGFDGIDMTFPKPSNNCELEDDLYYGRNYLEYAYKLKAELDKLGLSCVQAHAPLGFAFEDSFTEDNDRYRCIIRSLEITGILGAKYIVVHAIGVPEGVDLFEYNKQFYNSFIPYCEKFNVKIGIENLPVYNGKGKPWGERLGLPEKLSSFVKDLDQKYFVACVDLGHAALIYGLAEDFIRDMDGSVIKMLHVQECDFVRDLHTIPYSGGFNWNGILKELKNKGYNGDFSFEIFKYLSWFPDKLIPDALILAEKIGRYLIDLYENL